MKYDFLKQAIVVKAAEDYRKALKKRKKQDALDLEKWFLSDWGQYLSQGCGAIIVEKRKEEYKNNRKTKRRTLILERSALEE